MPGRCEPLPAGTILAAYGLEVARTVPLGAGLINLTFLVTVADGRRFVLQRLHEIFPAGVNDDIEVVTRHLLAKNMPTPLLLPASDGRRCIETDDGIWRMMTYVPGLVVERIESAQRAREAGALLGRFHIALADLDYGFPNARDGIHDTPRHLQNLESALTSHRDHPSFREIKPLASEIIAAADALEPLPETADRVVHGDPKITNFIFDPKTGLGVCLVDLDTLNRMPLPLELGDAIRSWCNPAGEDTDTTGFSAEFFHAACSGYASATGDWTTVAERQAIVPATLTIMVELAARFCADALQDRYFGWDPARFASRCEHNLVRARGQLAVFRECVSRRDELGGILEDAFSDTART